jgi:hypothetical protein
VWEREGGGVVEVEVVWCSLMWRECWCSTFITWCVEGGLKWLRVNNYFWVWVLEIVPEGYPWYSLWIILLLSVKFILLVWLKKKTCQWNSLFWVMKTHLVIHPLMVWKFHSILGWKTHPAILHQLYEFPIIVKGEKNPLYFSHSWYVIPPHQLGIKYSYEIHTLSVWNIAAKNHSYISATPGMLFHHTNLA